MNDKLHPDVAAVLAGERRWCVIEGDSLAILPTLPERSVDHVITDPPYNKRTHASAVCGATGGATGVSFAALASPSALSALLVRVAARWALAFCAVEDIGRYEDGAPDAWVRAGVWDKINPTPQLTGDRPGQAVEGIAILHRPGKKRWNRKGEAGIWRCAPPRGAERPEHPTPKPIALMCELVADFTDPDEVIADPFAGSGTTGIAAIRSGRRFIGIELDAKHAALARERIAAEVGGNTVRSARAGQVSMFAGGT